MLDYLAEITMSIMQKQRVKDPAAGYARDFVPLILDLANDLVTGGVRVVTNAGGVNPAACRDALVAGLADVDTPRPLRIAIVTGDDLMAIGSGGPYAQAAALALLRNTDLGARDIADKALQIAGDICVYTNQHITIEEL